MDERLFRCQINELGMGMMLASYMTQSRRS